MAYSHVKPVALVAMSPTKAATATGLSIDRIRTAISRGELRSHRIGVKTLVTADALRQWIESYPPASRTRHAVNDGESHVHA
jgi:excisionase family DNA binding protein